LPIVTWPAQPDACRKTGTFSVERGHPLLDLAVSSLATRPQVAGIIAVATRPEQVEQNVAAARWLLNPGELAGVDRMTADT
jgi:aryl-alcohol dehydrogenase-like predicted oxidoreductase